MTDWHNNHHTKLPLLPVSAWMNHGRVIGIHDKWTASIAIYLPEFDIVESKIIHGVQDDFGNFVKVDHANK